MKKQTQQESDSEISSEEQIIQKFENHSQKSQESSSSSLKRNVNEYPGKLYFLKQKFELSQFNKLITISSEEDENQFKNISEEIKQKRNTLQNQINNQINDNVVQKVKKEPIIISDFEQQSSQSYMYPSSIQLQQQQNQQNPIKDHNPENNQIVKMNKEENPQELNIRQPRQRTRQPYPQKNNSGMVYIADNQFSVNILKFFANQGQVKANNFSGSPFETKVNKYYDSQKGDLAKFYLSEEIKEPSYFFITKDNKEYEFINGKLKVKNRWLEVECNIIPPSKYKIIYEILKLISIQLDPEFVKELQIIVDTYVNMHQQGVQTDCIIDQVLSQNLKYMKIWETVKSHFKSVLLLKKYSRLQEKRISVKVLMSEKVKYKRFKQLEKEQLEIYKELKIRPIKYFLTELFQTFAQILYNEENQIKIEEENHNLNNENLKQAVDNKN